MNQHLQNVSIANARLPQAYEAAKQALTNCASVDECKDWADKAAALASYAKQANDEDLMKQATRIRDRAIRRMGEVLKQFDARPTNAEKQSEGDHTLISQRQAAEQAGITKHQQVQAVRVANVPQDDFERQVESEKPPTISQLAMQGIKPRPLVDLKGRDPNEFNRALHYIGLIEDYARDISEKNHEQMLATFTDSERKRVRNAIAKIDSIHDMIVTRI
jgi:hypothetical protein